MSQTSLYEDLAKRLDREVVVGAPMSPALLEILEILFPEEEARIALKLPFADRELAELTPLFPEIAGELEEKLARMARRGTVYTLQKPGKERVYRLLPSVVGWAETPFWAAKDTPEARKLAPLWLKYRNEAFGVELARGTPTVRVIPISRSLRDQSEILPFDALVPKIEAASFIAVGHCPCRQMMRYNGAGCDHQLENCLHFGSMARYMVEQEMARAITKEETLSILTAANEAGLVHACDNLDGHLSTICNCCACCCVFLQTKIKTGLETISRSNYVAQVDAELCAGCGTCADRCPMEAIKVGQSEVAEVDDSRCLGCGVCVPTCATEAVALGRRSEIAPPPDVSAFLTARYK